MPLHARSRSELYDEFDSRRVCVSRADIEAQAEIVKHAGAR